MHVYCELFEDVTTSISYIHVIYRLIEVGRYKIRQNHQNHKVRLTLSFCKTKTFFQKKIKFDSTRDWLNTHKTP